MGNDFAKRTTNVVLRAFAMGSRFALVFGLAKLLKPAEVGLFGLFLATVSFSVLVVGGSFYSYSQRELILSPREHWSFVIQHQAVAIGLLYLLFIPPQLLLFKYKLLPSNLILWFFLLLLVEHLSQELYRLLVAMRRQLVASAVFFLRMGAWVWIVLPLMWFNSELQSLEVVFLSWMVGSLISVIVGMCIVWQEVSPWRFWPVDYAWIKKGFGTGALFLVATLCFKAMFTVDRYAVEYLVGAELLGSYVLYSGMAIAAINFLDPAVFSFLYPRLVSACKNGDVDGYSRAMKELIWSTVSVSLLIIGLVYALAPFALRWVGNSVYVEHLSMLSLMLAVAFAYAIGMIPHYGLYAKGNDLAITAAHISALVVFVIVTFLVAKFLPFEAVGYGLLAALLWMACLKFFLYKKTLLLPPVVAEYVCCEEKV